MINLPYRVCLNPSLCTTAPCACCMLVVVPMVLVVGTIAAFLLGILAAVGKLGSPINDLNRCT